jgi:hypothetical protein
MLAVMVALGSGMHAPARAGEIGPPTVRASMREQALPDTARHEAPANTPAATRESVGDEATSATPASEDQVAAPAAPGSAAQRYALLLAGLGVMVWLRRRSTASQ